MSGEQIGTSAEDRHPLMSDDDSHGQSSPGFAMLESSSFVASPSSAGTPIVSAASAASVTSSPSLETTSRPRIPRPLNRNSKDEWDEDRSDDKPLADGLKKLEISQAASDLVILQKLMRQGSWLAIADKVKEARESMTWRPLDEILVFTTYHVLALMKLRNYAVAQEELLTLGDLNSPKFRFEQHSENYPNKAGSMVPFALRWLHAELPYRLGQPSTTIDRLYDLLAYCNERVDFFQNFLQPALGDGEVKAIAGTSHPGKHSGSLSPTTQEGTGGSHPRSALDETSLVGQSDQSKEQASYKLEVVDSNFISAEDLEDDEFGEFVASPLDVNSSGNIVHATLLSRWRRRQEVVLCSVLSHHLDQKDYVLCLNWLEELMKKRFIDPVVLSKYGYVQLQLGDLYGARRTFAAVETICEQQMRSSSPELAGLLSCNKGLLYFSLKQYAKAIKEFEAVLEADPGNVISANNKALCLMYSRDLVGATQVLESVLQASPITALNETLVLNLCSMYELASMNSVESKKTLSSWILRIAPDDFDLTCTRL